jgi:N-acetylneuraminic acid mutarotase
MPTARLSPVSVVINDKIYIIGGGNKVVECYDPATNTWEKLADMPTARMGCVSAVIAGRIYVIGGRNAESAFMSHELNWAYQSDGYRKSPAIGNNGFTKNRITFRTTAPNQTISIRYRVSSEPNYDWVIVGLLDVTLESDSSSCTARTSGESEREETVNVPSAGNHYIDIGYKKDASEATGSDCAWYRLLSGDSGESATNTVECYDPATNTWATLADMQTARIGCVSAVIDDRIYVIGGRNAESALATVECYDPVTNTWGAMASMSTAKQQGASVAVVDNKIYVIAGANANGAASNISECYDSITSTWEKLANMPRVKRFHTSAVIDGKIYAIGGENTGGVGLKTIECYDPATNAWATLADMQTARANSVSAVICDKIYVIGGYDDSELKATECFNPGLPARKWHSLGKVSDCLFDKEVSFNDVVYPANTPFSPNAVGHLAFSKTGTSGTLTEGFEDLELSIL